MLGLRVLACTAVGLALAVAGFELWLRLRGYDPLGELRRAGPVVIQRSSRPGLRYELRPSSRGPAWGADVAVNAAGFRDREYAAAKPPGWRRVIVLGDSVVFGTGLRIEETLSEQLETLLAEERVEVLNLGVGGYDTLEEVAFLEQVGLAFEPDLVLLVYCINDAGVHSLNLEYVERLEHFDSALDSLRIAQWWRARSADAEFADWSMKVNAEDEFARRYADRIASLAGDSELEALRAQIASYCSERRIDPTSQPFLAWYGSAAKLGRLRAALTSMAAATVGRGLDALVVFAPYLKSDEHAVAHERVRAIVAHECGRAGLRFDDPRPVLDSQPEARWRLSPEDGLHLGAAAHRRLAEHLRPLILDALRAHAGGAAAAQGR